MRAEMKIFSLIIFFCTLSIFSWAEEGEFSHLDYASAQEEIDKFLDLSFKDFDSLRFLADWQKSETHYSWLYPAHYALDDRVGYRLRPNTKSRHIVRTADEIIFDSTITVNSYGLRKSSHEDDSDRENLAVIAGCSWAFGHGLNDDQTVSSYIAQLDESYKSYNIGLEGRGPNVFIELIRNIPSKILTGFDKADLVYVYMTSHIDRAAGTLPSYEWLADTPLYVKNEEGRMDYVSSMKEANPWRNLFLEYMDKVHWLWNFGGERIFPRMTQKDYDYVCDLIVEMKNVWQDRVPHGRFLVYVHPMSNPFPEFESCFEKRGLKTYRSHLTGIEAGGHIIKGDGHPNHRTNRVVAEQILEVLRQSKW